MPIIGRAFCPASTLHVRESKLEIIIVGLRSGFFGRTIEKIFAKNSF
jgi:hypothetical protein